MQAASRPRSTRQGPAAFCLRRSSSASGSACSSAGPSARPASARSSAPSSGSSPGSVRSTSATGTPLMRARCPRHHGPSRATCCRRSASGLVIAARAAGLPRRRLADRRVGARRRRSGSRCIAIDVLLRRARGDAGNLAASGVQAFGLFFKSIGVLVVLIAAVVADPQARGRRGGDLRARLHVRARPLARHLLREHADEGPVPRRRTRWRSRCRRRRSRAASSTRRRSSSSTLALDPPRRARPLDHEGGRLPVHRRRADDLLGSR